MSREEILDMNGIGGEHFEHRAAIMKAMDEYAKESMLRLIKNISKQPIEVYSSKERGQDKKYFLGIMWVERVIKSIKS